MQIIPDCLSFVARGRRSFHNQMGGGGADIPLGGSMSRDFPGSRDFDTDNGPSTGDQSLHNLSRTNRNPFAINTFPQGRNTGVRPV